MNKSLLCIKLGGSIITDKHTEYKARRLRIRSIARIIKEYDGPMLISHGVGSFAHTSAKKYGGVHGYKSKIGIATVCKDAQDINTLVRDIFIEEGLPAISFSPRSFLLSRNDHMKDGEIAPIMEALHQELVPIIHGDVIFDTAQKTTIFSGERTLHIICQYLKRHNYPVDKVIQLCDVDGVLDSDGNVIPEITSSTWDSFKKSVTTSKAVDVTGGMLHKVEESLELASQGIQTIIMNGLKDTQLKRFITNKNVVGTVIK
jgi:isopentenyl phosphate kinase